MNFFEQQDRARQNTKYLIGLFILAVLSIIVTVYLAAALTLGGVSVGKSRRHRSYSYNQTAPTQVKRAFTWWNPQLFVMVAVPTTLLIGAGSLFKIQALKAGGAVVAAEMGGRLLLLETAEPAEKQLLNVVQEMAIAAGISVPQVYVMDAEQGINAFAAGFTPNSAVIGVTRGCIEQLTRDELQGVIGHEFSHILNGDMRLNLNIIGVLNGILLLYILGRVLADATSFRSRDEKTNGLFYFGIALIVIGSIGAFFGRLIKAAVSRQREFLADASAVQFTRNPDGIAGALHKISQHHYKSLVQSPRAEENSHLFFGSALRFDFLGELFATHPPVDKRIRRIRGNANRYLAATPANMPRLNSSAASESLVAGFAGGNGGSQFNPPSSTEHVNTVQPNPDAVVAQVGTVAPEHYAYAKALVAQLPDSLKAGIEQRQSAIAIMYSLFLDTEKPDIRTQQFEWLRQVQPAHTIEQVKQFAPDIDSLDPKSRLPLLDLTIPMLRQSTAAQCQELFKVVQGLVRADGRWLLTEFSLQVVLWHRLQPCLNPDLDTPIKFSTLNEVWTDCLTLLSVLAQVGQTKPDAIAYSFRSGVFRLPEAGQQSVPDVPLSCTVNDLKKSLERLRFAAPKLKQGIVDACAHTVLIDNTVSLQEAELLRAIAITLDCPLPPFLSVGERQKVKGKGVKSKG